MYFRNDNELFSTVDGTLKYRGYNSSTGSDSMGDFVQHELIYTNDDGAAMRANIMEYDE